MNDDYKMTLADKLTIWAAIICAILISAGLGFKLI